jgi:hypothetical protein
MGLTMTLIVAACGSSSGGIKFRCDRSRLPFHSCDEYDNLDSAGLASEESGCKGDMESAVGAGPPTPLLGTCTLPHGSIVTRILVYSDVGGETVAMAAAWCASGGGTWTPS